MDKPVISPQNLISKIRRYQPDADTTMVELAFEFAKNAHEGQFRTSGEPYITHPLAAAEILADSRLPVPIIIAALLHDVPEDTSVTLEEIRANFGEDIASMVGGITKLGKLKYRGIDRYVENLRKMFIAMASDVRVIIIKFADRIHNLMTLDALTEEKRRRVALESLEIYAPIANRLGLNEFKTQIEDLSFKYIMPKEYEWTAALAERAITVKQTYIEHVRNVLETELKANNIPSITIQGRVKHLYSLYKKLLKAERDIVQIHDLIALRVIVNSIADCYATLGIIHQKWKPIRGRIKDYIAQPKPNGYQSLHTTVICEDGEIVEFQIRTHDMHEEAERGIAAHWKYDEDGKRSLNNSQERLGWVQELAEQQESLSDDPESYLESLEAMKIDVFANRIFVFTPKGDVIDLPEGATVVDFAYAVHSQIGNTCVAGRINDHMVALDTTLSSGDCCEIITEKNRKSPNPDWLTFVKTSHARNHIRASAKAKAKAARPPSTKPKTK